MDIGAVEQRHGITFDHYFADSLRQLALLEEDGLVEIGRRRIDITPRGRLLMRNIAMCFDAYLTAAGFSGAVVAVTDGAVVLRKGYGLADRARPGRQLLSHAGLSAAEIDALRPLEGPANERLSAPATEFVRRLNTLEIHPHARRLVSDLVARSQNLFAADAPREGTS